MSNIAVKREFLMSTNKPGISGNAEERGDCAATPAAKARVRDRIFDSACELFYRHGIHGVRSPRKRARTK